MKKKVERLPSFRFIVSTAVEAAPTRRAHRDAQTPHLCEFRLAVEFSLAINFIIAPVNSSVARHSISLSSGIRMFARESETRVDLLNHCFCFRAEC